MQSKDFFLPPPEIPIDPNIIQNLELYFKTAKIEDKQKLIGSIFQENLIIENGKCRTARECEVILSLKGKS
ncbi:MAG: hypothetical protein K2X86_19055 [Cytophagaceae bacterium]|nr:hypothetical protein [Cytophagaceae bacterium]